MELKKITTPAEIDLVRSFFFAIFPEEPHYDLAEFYASLSGKHPYRQLDYFLALVDQTPVGFCGIYSANETECWLGWFGVRPEYRRRGYAKQILSLLYDKMRQTGYQICRLYTDKVINANAFQLYINQGFTTDNHYNYDFITMVKPLVPDINPKKWTGTPLGFESEPPHHFSSSTETK